MGIDDLAREITSPEEVLMSVDEVSRDSLSREERIKRGDIIEGGDDAEEQEAG